MLRDDCEVELKSPGLHWAVSWHPPHTPPEGIPHGSAGICITAAHEVVLVSTAGETWDFPAGRPEGRESWQGTLFREMLEEGCAVVCAARLLGFSRGRCCAGPEEGRVLVRSIWLANVQLLDWSPQFEIRQRRLVPIEQAIACAPAFYRAVWQRAFYEAGLV